MKFLKKNKLLAIIATLIVGATVAYAAGFERIPKDTLLLGTGSGTSKVFEADLGLGANNPKFRFNSGAPQIESALDGVSFLPIGSGGGGGTAGVDVITNGDFELGTGNNWTASGGTFEDATGGDILNGTKSACWTPSAASETLTSDQATLPVIVDGNNCRSKFWYKDGDANVYAEIIDGSSNVLGTKRMELASTRREVWIPYECPTSDTVAFRLRANSAAAKICFDDVKAGILDRERKSLELNSVADPAATINGGGFVLNDGRVLKTYDGSGTNSSDYGEKLSIDLDTILGSNPVDSTTYSLCVDKDTLGSAITLSDTGEKVVSVEEANFKLLTTAPEDTLLSRYVCLAWIRSASTGTVWSGANSSFDDFPRNTQPTNPVAVNPIIYSHTQDIGTVGSVANAKGPIEDADFPTPANVRYFHLDNDDGATILEDGGRGDDLTKNGTFTFDDKGLFSRETIANFNGTDSHLSSTSTFYNATNTMTVGVDLKFPMSTIAQDIVNKYSGGSGQRSYLIFHSGNTFRCAYSTDGTALVQTTYSNTNLLKDGIHHFVCRYDLANNKIAIFVDGQKVVDETVADNSFFASTNPLYIGARDGTSNFLEDSISDLFITKDLYTDAQINHIYSKRHSNNQQIAGGHILTNESFPFDNAAGKLAYWNLNDLNDDSGALTCTAGTVACTLTNDTVVTFDGYDIFGTQRIGIFPGNSQLEVADNLFKSKVFTTGALFYKDSWQVGVTEYLLSNSIDTNDRGFLVSLSSAGVFSFAVSSDGTTSTSEVTVSIDKLKEGWNHLTFSYGLPNAKVYANGVLIGSNSNSNTLVSPSVGKLIIGGVYDVPTANFNGKIQDVFYTDRILSDDDIFKLAAAKVPHNVNTPIETQEWLGLYKREDSLIKNQLGADWLVDKTTTDMYVNFGLEGTSEVNLKLKDLGFSPTLIPIQKFNAFYTSDPCVGAECSINHGLPGRPSVEVWYEVTAGEWALQDGTTCHTTETQLVCNFSAIPVIDGARRINVKAAMSDISSAFEGDPVTTGTQTFSGNKIWNGTNRFTGGFDTTGSDGLATDTNAGLLLKNKIETKEYANLTAGQSVSRTLTLTSGQLYKVTVYGRFWRDDINVATDALLQDDGATMLQIGLADKTGIDTTDEGVALDASKVFVADGSVYTVLFRSLGAGQTGIDDPTITVEEIQNKEVVTGFLP